MTPFYLRAEMKKTILYILLLLIQYSIHSQEILCFSAEDSTSIKSFDVYAASDDFTFSGKKIEKENLETYLYTPICLRTIGFRDTCFVLQKGVNYIHLSLISRILEPLEINGNFSATSKFKSTIEKYMTYKRDQKRAHLTYSLKITLRDHDSTIFQKLEGILQLETNKFKRKKNHHQFKYSSLALHQYTSTFYEKNKLDSLNIINPLTSILNECFWNYRSDWGLILKGIQESRPFEVVVSNKHDSITIFNIERQFIKTNKTYSHSMSFNDNGRLLNISSNDPNFIHPYRFIGDKKRQIRSLEIIFSPTDIHIPNHIILEQDLIEGGKYILETRLEIIKIDDTNIDEYENTLPYAWPYSTLAWLRLVGIPVGD
jgi:hypothetical protein